MLQLLQTQPLAWAAVFFAVVASIVLHELGHALAATWEGDDTPRLSGHLTWNPVVHMGWISIALAAFVGIAWGLTPVNPRRFRHRRWGEVIVAAAGPAVNLGLAVMATALLHLSTVSGAPAEIAAFWWIVALLNVALFLLNMIPVPPLDGFTVLDGAFGMGEVGRWLRSLGSWPMLFVLVLMMRFGFFGYVQDGVELLSAAWAHVLPGTA